MTGADRHKEEKMRYTEYHNGVAVIKDKSLMKEAMQKLAEYEDAEDENKAKIANIENMSREDVIGSLHDYCGNRNCGSCIFAKENCAFTCMNDAELRDAYKRVLEISVEASQN